MTTGYLGEFEHLVLLAIARAGGTAGGARVHREIEQVARRDVSLPSIYVTIARLERKGFVRTAGLEAREEGGRPRRMFEVTASGAIAMRDTRRTLERMWTEEPATARSRR
jgi:DNA-binding PadR family transcriptional regulator